MIAHETYTLSNGVTIPKLGLGTWMIEDGAAARAVRDAVDLGYRHIDTAEGYANERGVGDGIRSCGLARDAILVTTKLQAAYKTYAEAKGILVEAYSPIAHGEILGRADLAAMARSYGVGVAQLCIRYCLQLGLLPLPKTATPAHMRANAAVDFTISDADMAVLKAVTPLSNYGAASRFPVFGGKLHDDGTLVARS